MRQYRKKIVILTCTQYDGSPEKARQIIDWTRDSATRAFIDKDGFDHPQLYINTLEGTHLVGVNDWVVCGIKGEFYPIKPDIFAGLYEAVE